MIAPATHTGATFEFTFEPKRIVPRVFGEVCCVCPPMIGNKNFANNYANTYGCPGSDGLRYGPGCCLPCSCRNLLPSLRGWGCLFQPRPVITIHEVINNCE